jgi:hypothetical protein
LYADSSSISYFETTIANPDSIFDATAAQSHQTTYGNLCGAGYFCVDRGDSTTPQTFCEYPEIQAYIDLETAQENSGIGD